MENQTTELKNDPIIQKEECKALFFDHKKLIEPKKTLFRLNNYSNGRYYYSFDDKGEPLFYISVTNLIQQTTPTSPGLIKWIAEKGYEEADNYKEERADYGTLMHILFQELLINKTFNLDSLNERVKIYAELTFNQDKIDEWIEDLKSDLLAFAQWIIDFQVEPVLIEKVLSSEKELIAGALDLGCYLSLPIKGYFGEVYKSGVNKGKPKETKMNKRVFAIVDFKSGRKAFYEDNEIQLKAYELMFRENFPDFIEEEETIHLFNFSPKSWRSSPSYNFKDQTDSPNGEKLPHLLEIGKIQQSKRQKNIILKKGIIDFSKTEKSISQNFESVVLTEYLKEDKSKADKAKNDAK